jgi:SAM-dependent methyltransferase
MTNNGTIEPNEVIAHIRERVRARRTGEPEQRMPRVDARTFVAPSAAAQYDWHELHSNLAACNALHSAVGTINPRRPGLHNDIIQFAKNVMRRSLTWYTRPLHEFHGAVTRTLNETSIAIQQLRAALDSMTGQMTTVRSDVTQLRSDLEHTRRELLRSVDTGEGAKARAGLYFNEPVMVDYNERGQAYWAATSERVVERSWLFRESAALPPGCRILDVGCSESLISFELASAGFKVVGVDIRDYSLHHPNLQFLRADICNTGLQPCSFDAAVALSTVEHIGLGFYGDTSGESALDSAMNAIWQLLRPGAPMLLTVPFGRSAVTPQHRIFDSDSLRLLLRRFSIDKLEFAVKLDVRTWRFPAGEEEAAVQSHDAKLYAPGAVATAVCRKPTAHQSSDNW